VRTEVVALVLLGALDACSLVLGLDEGEFDPDLESSAAQQRATGGASDDAGAGGASAGASSPDGGALN
jgi:hypothetical protein